MPEPVIVAIPPKGGTLDDVLKRLVQAGWLRDELVQAVRQLIKADKRRIKLETALIGFWDTQPGDMVQVRRKAEEAGHSDEDVDAALGRMRRYSDVDGRDPLTFSPKPAVDQLLHDLRQQPDPLIREAAMTLHLELDLNRYGRPTRMMFDHMEFDWQAGGKNVRGVLVGTEHEVTPTYLRKHKRDLSLTCYDAFHATLLDALDTGRVRNWRELMDHLIEANTDVRILGSLGLQDYLGHFVLMHESQAQETAALGGSRRWNDVPGDPKIAQLSKQPILIDAQYEAVYQQLLGDAGANITFECTTHDIEDACANEHRCAIYIVRSGSTIARTPGLCVVGEELITSESIVAVNQERLESNYGVGMLIDSLAPSIDDESDQWRARLSAKLGDKLI